ncbi:hypothetical protein [Ruminococcus sp.]|uniref:hypothetical protein n=1 Tax=Ruminococcus sp. TaxID=41978 RepID=UPI0025FD3CCF|nr:hypothetical protein [Ruminococcus sp.]
MKRTIDFSDADVRKRLERQAYDGTLDVSDFPPAEYMYFSELRRIYYDYKFESLSKEDAELKKRLLIRRYNEAASEHIMFCRVYKDYQNNIRKAGTLISQIHKSHDIREIAQLACAAIGLMQGDNSFASIISHKLEELQ